MSKLLTEMSLPELWRLFPIELVPPNSDWLQWYQQERQYLSNIIADERVRIHHIGSTTNGAIWAKPIIDILLEVPDQKVLLQVSEILAHNGYLCMSATEKRISYNKGYTPAGFAERAFHLHLRLYGDNDELYFRDYLLQYPETAKAYEHLKLSLWEKYKYNRDAYTEAKTEFIMKQTERAKKEFKQRYQR